MPSTDTRELKQRRRERPLVKNEFIFYKQNSRLSRSVQCANGYKNVSSQICNDGIPAIPKGNTRSLDDAEFGHFKLLKWTDLQLTCKAVLGLQCHATKNNWKAIQWKKLINCDIIGD